MGEGGRIFGDKRPREPESSDRFEREKSVSRRSPHPGFPWEPNLGATACNGPVSMKKCTGIRTILQGGKIGASLSLETRWAWGAVPSSQSGRRAQGLLPS